MGSGFGIGIIIIITIFCNVRLNHDEPLVNGGGNWSASGKPTTNPKSLADFSHVSSLKDLNKVQSSPL